MSDDVSVTTDIGPFAIVPLWILEALLEEPGDARAVQIFVMLHRWTNHDRTCFPSQGRIAEELGITTATVRRALQTLETIGAIEIIPRLVPGTSERTSNLYRLMYGGPRNIGRTSDQSCEDPSYQECSSKHTHSEADSEKRESRSSGPVEIVTVEDSTFERFWDLYPRKTGKSVARRAWKKLSEDQRDLASRAIVEHDRIWKAEKRKTQFIPHASTWLNQARFDDDLEGQYETLVEKISRFAVEAARVESKGSKGAIG